MHKALIASALAVGLAVPALAADTHQTHPGTHLCATWLRSKPDSKVGIAEWAWIMGYLDGVYEAVGRKYDPIFQGHVSEDITTFCRMHPDATLMEAVNTYATYAMEQNAKKSGSQ